MGAVICGPDPRCSCSVSLAPKDMCLTPCPVSARELATPPLDGTILPGVTRDSILQLTAGWGEFAVTERHVTIREAKKVRSRVCSCGLQD